MCSSKSGSRIKILEDKVELTIGESNNVKRENRQLTTKIGKLIIEVNTKNEETQNALNAAENLKIELEREKNYVKYNCDHCEHASESQSEMKVHIQMNHNENKCIQVPNIRQVHEEYFMKNIPAFIVGKLPIVKKT